MSEVEHYKGKLIPVASGRECIEYARKTLSENGIDTNVCDDFIEELIYGELYKEYLFIGGTIYKADLSSVDIYDDIYIASKNTDSTIDIEIKYYNGGCSMGEAVEAAMRNVGIIE